MDNQHDLNEMAYLAGVIDGDGHLRLAINNAKDYKVIIPSIEICNTNLSVIQFCRDVLVRNGIKTNFYINSKTGGKPYYCIIARSQNRCRKLVAEIKPYLIEKKNQARIMLGFIEWRNKSSRDYTHVDWKWVDRFKLAKKDDGILLNNCCWSYIAGLIDAEGSITLDGARPRKHGKISAILPRVRFSNTNLVLIDYIANAYQWINVNPHFHSKTLKSGKKYYELSVNGLAKTKRLLDKMSYFLIGKIGQANIVLDFINHRLALAQSGNSKKKYTDFELGLLHKIQAMNK